MAATTTGLHNILNYRTSRDIYSTEQGGAVA